MTALRARFPSVSNKMSFFPVWLQPSCTKLCRTVTSICGCCLTSAIARWGCWGEVKPRCHLEGKQGAHDRGGYTVCILWILQGYTLDPPGLSPTALHRCVNSCSQHPGTYIFLANKAYLISSLIGNKCHPKHLAWLGFQAFPLLSQKNSPCFYVYRWSFTRFACLGKKSWDAPTMIKGFIACNAPQWCKRGVEDMRSPQWFPVQRPVSFQRTDVLMRKGLKGLAWLIYWVYMTWHNS